MNRHGHPSGRPSASGPGLAAAIVRHHSPATVSQELARIKVADVILPNSTGRRIRLQCITEPDELQRVLLNRLGLQPPGPLGEPRCVRQANVVPNSA